MAISLSAKQLAFFLSLWFTVLAVLELRAKSQPPNDTPPSLATLRQSNTQSWKMARRAKLRALLKFETSSMLVWPIPEASTFFTVTTNPF
jgi:hypothetical protein